MEDLEQVKDHLVMSLENAAEELRNVNNRKGLKEWGRDLAALAKSAETGSVISEVNEYGK